MKITVTKEKRELAKKNFFSDDVLIKEIILIINEQLVRHKNITIIK